MAARRAGRGRALMRTALWGLLVGSVIASAIMFWLTRSTPPLSRAEREAADRARGASTAPLPVIETAPDSVIVESATTVAQAVDSAASDSAMGIAPPVIGLSEGAARTLIEQAGFAIGGISSISSDRPVGEVVATFPEPGERVVLPASINLIISSGPAPAKPDSVSPHDPLQRLIR
jgi:hypothetical protein